MASTISAGLTTGTAIAIAGDTSGSLVLQTNGTTTAVTISTAQVVTLAQPLPVASGGTGLATLTANNVILGAGTSSPTFVAPSTSGNYLTSNGTTWVSSTPAAGGVTTFNGSTTGLTPATATSGAITLGGTLAVANGGTGVTTSTGTGANVLGTSPTLTTPTFNSAQLATVSGTAPLYMCRAWVNFNGQGTVAIRASANVSSITDNGAGAYTVNFTTAMSDANYSICINASLSYSLLNIFSPSLNTDSTGAESAPTTTSCSTYIATSNTTPFDSKYVNVSIFR